VCSSDLKINGEGRTLDAATISDLLRLEGVDADARFVAVALNGAVVPRRDWSAARIAAGDDVEIVKPVSGG